MDSFDLLRRNALRTLRVNENRKQPFADGAVQGILAHTESLCSLHQSIRVGYYLVTQHGAFAYPVTYFVTAQGQDSFPVFVSGLNRIEGNLLGGLGVAALEPHPHRIAARAGHREQREATAIKDHLQRPRAKLFDKVATRC